MINKYQKARLQYNLIVFIIKYIFGGLSIKIVNDSSLPIL